MRIIGIGDLVADLYYKNNELVGADGGKTTSNIIANLSYLGFKTAMIGNCGNDIYGKIALDSLKRLGVDISKIIVKDIDTKKFHNVVDDGISTSRCPYCNKKPIYRSNKIDIEYIKKYITKEDIIVIDNITLSNEMDMADLSKTNDIMLDIGYYNSLRKLSDNEIIRLLSNKFTIINMNNRVKKFLTQRLNINDMELFKLLNVKMLIITKGKEGADFLYSNNLISKKLINVGTEVDVNGAGDAFFAVVISEYINNDFKISNKMIDSSFDKATSITARVVSFIGARSHMRRLYKVKKIDNICSCRDISL